MMENVSFYNWTSSTYKHYITSILQTNNPSSSLSSYVVTQGQTTLHNGSNAFLWLTCFPLLTVVGSLVTCLAVRWDKRMHHTSYYFAVSMAVLHTIMSATVMPPAIVVTWQGEYRCSDSLCKFWITSDLFFCNNTCLHLAFMNMDTFLRLKDPLRHGRNVTLCSLMLWLGAPWAVSFVQSVAQFMLSQADEDSRAREGLCFIADKNFVILGTIFSFVIPSIVAGSFAVLCRSEIRALRGRVFCNSGGMVGGLSGGIDDARSSHGSSMTTGGRLEEGIQTSTVDFEDEESQNASDTTTGDSDNQDSVSERHDIDRASVVTEQVQMEIVTASGELMETCRLQQGAAALCDSSIESNCEETTAFYCKRREKDRAKEDGVLHDGVNTTDQTSSCTLLLRATDDHQVVRVGHTVDDYHHHHNIPDQTLRQEMTLSRLTTVMMSIHIILWLPLSVSNVVYGVCQQCRDGMTFTEAMTFKWLAYGSAVVGTLTYGQFSEPMRQFCWNMITCRQYGRRQRNIP